jgi:transcriptional regulator with XRE-family HTH domain
MNGRSRDAEQRGKTGQTAEATDDFGNLHNLGLPKTGNAVNRIVTPLVIDSEPGFPQSRDMLNTKELLARLDERGITNRQVARAIGVSDSRITEIRKGERQVKLEEAVKLVHTFGLEQGHAPPLRPEVLRLVALHISQALDCQVGPDDPAMTELVADLAAFSRFVADPLVRGSVEKAESFFQAM